MAVPLDRTALRRYIERSIQDLPPLPKTVAKVLELTNRSNSTASELDYLISADQAITSKILKVVNSAYYGLSGQVVTVAHAIVILGFQQVRNLVLSMAAMNLMKKQSPPLAKIQHAFWRHAFGAAAAANILADHKSLSLQDRDVVQIGGLLHNIGALFLLSNFENLYRATLRIAVEKSIPLETAEQSVLGIDHAEVGGMITRSWKFPEPLVTLIEAHHGPFKKPLDVTVAITHAADYYVSLAGYTPIANGSYECDPAVIEWLSLSDGDVESLTESVRVKVQAAEELFELI